MFSLAREEILGISQFVISLKYSKSVYAFTEQGVAMLSGVLNSPRAVEINIAIMSRRHGCATCVRPIAKDALQPAALAFQIEGA